MQDNRAQILIVDDNPHNIQVLAAVMAESGYETGIAMSAMEAYDFLEETLPDLILLDIMMPEVNGFDACRRIKSNPLYKDIPIIFLSAKAEKDDIIAGFEAGGIDYLTKPFNRAELKVRVKTHIELKQSADRIREYNLQLEKLNGTKDLLFSIIAHDLRNPIGATKSLADLLVDDYFEFADEDRIEFLKSIASAATGVFSLLEDLLLWAKTQRDQVTYNPEKFELNALVESVFSLTNTQALGKHITLINEVPYDTFVYADLNMISTVLRNLITNGIKFTKSEGVIRIVRKEESAGKYTISIQDTGVGLTPEQLNSLFKIGKRSTLGTNNEKGTGLGLMICKEFIEKHDCGIWVESELGTGSRFNFTIPIFLNH